MIQANELRIGNWISHAIHCEKVQVDYVLFEIIGDDSSDLYHGIEIYGGWIERFGFKKHPEYSWKGNGYDYQPETSKTTNTDYILNDNFFVRFSEWSYRKDEDSEWKTDKSFSIYRSEWYERCEEREIVVNECKYLHQLQNIYFMLFSQELDFVML